MADYIVTSGELTSVANAIREKNGTNSSLSWPNGFVSGIGSGGGGSSDFSTAEVTVVNQKNSDISFIMPVIMEAEDDYPATVLSTTTMLAHSTVHNVAPLYKGEADATTDPGNTIAITGNATNEGEYIFITGDCTITIS